MEAIEDIVIAMAKGDEEEENGRGEKMERRNGVESNLSNLPTFFRPRGGVYQQGREVDPPQKRRKRPGVMSRGCLITARCQKRAPLIGSATR